MSLEVADFGDSDLLESPEFWDEVYRRDRVAFAIGTGLDPDPWQKAFLRSKALRISLNCCRQSGKSSIAATLAVHTALYRDRSLVLLLSPGLRQSGELFRKCLSIYRAAGRPVLPESETKLTLDLANGSRIVSLPGSEETVRGYSGVALLVVDEAARVQDDFYFAVRPMLAVSGGRLITLSTPFGKRGWWHEAWVNGGPSWERIEVKASECPRISAEFLAEERKAMPPWFYSGEYECQFTETDSSVFGYDLVMGLLSADVEPLFQQGEAGPLSGTLSEDVERLMGTGFGG